MSDPPSLPAAAIAPDARTEKLNTKAAGIITLAVMCSRVLGLAREQVFAALFGGGAAMDAFTAAFRIPNLLRDLFAEGALSTAFVTTFSKTIARGGDDAAWRLANKVATLTAVVLGALCLAGMVFSVQLVALLAPGFDPEKAALTALLTRIMFPFILLVSLAALVMGMLNSKSVFGMPAMASSFFNIGSIVGGVTLGFWIDPQFGPRALLGLGMATVLGGALQLAVQLPSLARLSLQARFSLARRRREGNPAVDGSLGDRREHHAIQCADQFDVRIDARRRTDFLALDRVPIDSAAVGSVRCRARYRDLAAAVAAGGGRPHHRISHRARAGDAPRAAAHDSLHGGAHHARRTDHFSALSARQVHRLAGGTGGRWAALLRHWSRRLRRAQGVGERVLCARPAQDPDARELPGGGLESPAQLDLHFPPGMGISRTGVLDGVHRDVQFLALVCADAQSSRWPRDAPHAPDARQSRGRHRGAGCGLRRLLALAAGELGDSGFSRQAGRAARHRSRGRPGVCRVRYGVAYRRAQAITGSHSTAPAARHLTRFGISRPLATAGRAKKERKVRTTFGKLSMPTRSAAS